MAYELVTLLIGAGAAIGAILAAADISRKPVYYVGLEQPPRTGQTLTQETSVLTDANEEDWTEQTQILTLLAKGYAAKPSIGAELHWDRLDYLLDDWLSHETLILQPPEQRRPPLLSEEVKKYVMAHTQQVSAVERHEREIDELEKRIRRLEEKAYRTEERRGDCGGTSTLQSD